MTEIFHPEKDCKVKVKNIEAKVNKTFDEHGKLYDQKYVEFTVIGKHREYQDHMLLEDFRRHNPHVTM